MRTLCRGREQRKAVDRRLSVPFAQATEQVFDSRTIEDGTGLSHSHKITEKVLNHRHGESVQLPDIAQGAGLEEVFVFGTTRCATGQQLALPRTST